MSQSSNTGRIFLLLSLIAAMPPIARAEPIETVASRAAIEVQANVFTLSAQEQVAVDATADGRTLAVWASRRQESGSYGVYARAFDASGRALSEEIHVNHARRGAQHRPAVAVSGAGAWVVWESTGQDGSGSGVVARRLGGDFSPVGREIAVNVERWDDQISASVATDSKGRALIVWSSRATAGTASIRGRLFAANGEALSEEMTLSGGANDELPTVVELPSDRFLVVWPRRSLGNDLYGIYGRVVESDGKVREAELALVPESTTAQIEPAVAVDAGGRFVVAWLVAQEPGYAVALRRFDAQSKPAGPIRRIAEPNTGWKSGVAVAMEPGGRFAISYNSDGQDGDGVYAQVFAADGRRLETLRVNRTTGGSQAATLASGARRSVWSANDLLAFAWNGDSGNGDSSAANLTLLAPPGAEVADTIKPSSAPGLAAKPIGYAEVAGDEAQAAIPPIWDPGSVPLAPLPAGRLVGGDFGFEAVTNTGWTPPDPEIAVGPDDIVVMTNGEISAFDRQGTLQWSDEIENTQGFWGELGADNLVFDPEVIFDPHSQRFMAMANERSDDSRSFFLLAVSQDESPDDRDDWHKYRLDVTALSGSDIDSPNMGLSRDYVLLTADFFIPQDRYLLYIIDKSSILEGGGPVTTSELIIGEQSMGVPMVTSDTATLYILQSTELGSNNTVIFHAITDPFNAYLRQTFTLSVPTYTFPARPPQQGTTVRPILFEPRFWSTAEQDGSIWAVHHVGSSRSRARWYQFDLGGWPTGGGTPSMTQHGEIDLGDGISTFFPSIQVDDAGNAAITFARSAANEFFSIGRAVRAAGDPADTFRPVQVVQTSNNPDNSQRWGDYSGTWADPVNDGTFWGHHEFTVGGWRTWVARYDLRAAPMLLAVNRRFGGGEFPLSVTGATPGETVVFYATQDGTGLTEVPAQQVTLSLENALEVASAVADENGVATTSANLSAGTLVQAAEPNHTTNWLEVTVIPLIFIDGFESGDTSAWTNTSP